MKMDPTELNAFAPKRRLIFFTTDAGFLLPTIQAAMQVAAQARVTAIADILIFLVDMLPADKLLLEAAFAGRPFRFELLDPALPDASSVAFNQTHVPLSTLARLATGALIPDQYEHLVYLDGDIQITGDIYPLVSHNVTEGHIAAANDTTWLCEGDSGPYWRRMRLYLDGIGVADPHDYFNAGVLAFRRSTWAQVAPTARDFFLSHSAACLFHDQSALNAVCVGRREVLPPIYNFISGYAEIGAQEDTAPRIIHFTGAAKPWFSRCWPWYGQFIGHYDDLLQRYPILADYHPRRPPEDIVAIEMDVVRSRRRVSLRTPWRRPLRRLMYRRYAKSQLFALPGITKDLD